MNHGLVTYHIVQNKPEDFFIFRQAPRDNKPDGLTLLPLRPHSLIDAVEAVSEDMVKRAVPGNINIVKFPGDFIITQYMDVTIDFKES